VWRPSFVLSKRWPWLAKAVLFESDIWYGQMGKLQHESGVVETSDMPNLVCDCGEILGYPMKHKDGRLAFRLERGKFTRKRSKITK